jgi:thiamine-phosphate pyrophosphorylase
MTTGGLKYEGRMLKAEVTSLTRPIVCLVTDRRRLAPGAATGEQIDRVVAQVAEAAAAGADLVQIRERDLEAGALVELVGRAVDALRAAPTRVVVNDRLDVALAAGARGVHLRSESFPPSRARAVVPGGFLVGRSVHDAGEAAALGSSVDYVVFGAVYASASKAADHPIGGVTALAEAVARTTAPVLAIGGVTVERLAEIAATGAAGVAAIGLFLPPDGSPERAGVARAVAAVRRAFDTSRHVM